MLTRRELDHMKCEDPDCSVVHDEPLVLGGKCHPEADLEGRIFGDGKGQIGLMLRCAVCAKRTVTVALDSVDYLNKLTHGAVTRLPIDMLAARVSYQKGTLYYGGVPYKVPHFERKAWSVDEVLNA